MNIHTFSSYSEQAGSARVRIFDWLRHLSLPSVNHTYAGQRDARPRTLVRHLPAVIAAERSLRRIDVSTSTVVISREVSPLSSGSLEKTILSSAERSIYDFDDAIFHNTSQVRRLLRQDDKCLKSVLAADLVVAGNDYLADWASKHSESVVMIPSCVEPRDYQPKTSWEVGARPLLVWLGSPATEQYLAHIAPALAAVHARLGARLRLISGPQPNPRLTVLEHMIDRVPWTKGGVAAALSGADVAIGPLTDTMFARGKCAYKLLQYAATGLPMVGTPIGANEKALSRFDGLPASSEMDWISAIEEILLEPASRRRIRGQTGMIAVQEHYSFATWAPQWADALGIRAGDAGAH